VLEVGLLGSFLLSLPLCLPSLLRRIVAEEGTRMYGGGSRRRRPSTRIRPKLVRLAARRSDHGDGDHYSNLDDDDSNQRKNKH
jgi:hypothetical protein